MEVSTIQILMQRKLRQSTGRLYELDYKVSADTLFADYQSQAATPSNK